MVLVYFRFQTLWVDRQLWILKVTLQIYSQCYHLMGVISSTYTGVYLNLFSGDMIGEWLKLENFYFTAILKHLHTI